jgi:Raf kinase inhibitor-like YbhB/YbcL family protein
MMDPGLRGIKSKRRAGSTIALAIAALIAFLAMLISSRREPTSVRGQTESTLRVTSSSFSDGGAIPRRYTCDGADISPELKWTPPPAGTRSLALVMHDPDAPVDFTHWLAYNISPAAHQLAEGASPGNMPQGAIEGTNGFDRFGYGGPCPPAGNPHHYVFRIYALDTQLHLAPGVTRNTLESAIGHHVIAEGRIVGLYSR